VRYTDCKERPNGGERHRDCKSQKNYLNCFPPWQRPHPVSTLPIFRDGSRGSRPANGRPRTHWPAGHCSWADHGWLANL